MRGRQRGLFKGSVRLFPKTKGFWVWKGVGLGFLNIFQSGSSNQPSVRLWVTHRLSGPLSDIYLSLCHCPFSSCVLPRSEGFLSGNSKKSGGNVSVSTALRCWVFFDNHVMSHFLIYFLPTGPGLGKTTSINAANLWNSSTIEVAVWSYRIAGDQKSGLGVWSGFYRFQPGDLMQVILFILLHEMTTKIPSSVHACVALLWLCFWWTRETQPIIRPRLPPFHILVHKKAASPFSEASSLQAWQPLSPGPAPQYHPHPFCHHSGLLVLSLLSSVHVCDIPSVTAVPPACYLLPDLLLSQLA